MDQDRLARRLVLSLFAEYGDAAFDVARQRAPELAEAITRYQKEVERQADEHLHEAVRQDAPVLPVGQRIGKWRIESAPESGGQGTVYRAWDEALKRRVALKILPALVGAHEYREAQALAALNHPGVVTIYEVGSFAGSMLLAMELVDGETLHQALRALPRREHGRDRAQLIGGGASSFQAVARLGECVADALHAAHLVRVVHCDVKPSNIVLAAGGATKVIDFGIARLPGEEAIGGTREFMAPEQLAREGVTPATDVFGLGATLYECLTGRKPFETDRRPLAAPRPSCVRRDVPADLDAICAMALQPVPAARYGSAAEMRDDLRRFLRGEPVNANPVGAVGRALRLARRRPVPVGLAAFAGVLLVVVTVLALRHAHHQAEAANRSALIARQQTELAERRETIVRQERAARAASAAATARIAREIGDWETVLNECDRAEASGHEDPVELGILRFEAHEGQRDPDRARAELARIRVLPGAQAWRAALAIRETFAPAGFADAADQEKAARLALAYDTAVREGRESGHPLSAGDRALCRAMTADDIETALAEAQEGIALDPRHRGLNQVCVLLLVASARLPEAEAHAAAMRLAYPRDLIAVLGHGLLVGMRHGAEATRAAFAPAWPWLGDEGHAWADLVGDAVEAWTLVRRLMTASALEDRAAVVACGRPLFEFIGTPRDLPGRLHLLLPRSVVVAFEPLRRELLDLLVFGQRASAALQTVSHRLGDGTFVGVDGLIRTLGEDFALAEAALRRALDLRLGLLPRKAALLALLRAQAGSCSDDPGGAVACRQRAQPTLRALLQTDLSARELACVVDACSTLGAEQAQVGAAARFVTENPDVPEARCAWARALAGQGAFESAADVLRDALRVQPDHEAANELLQQVVREQNERDWRIVLAALATLVGRLYAGRLGGR